MFDDCMGICPATLDVGAVEEGMETADTAVATTEWKSSSTCASFAANPTSSTTLAAFDKSESDKNILRMRKSGYCCRGL